MASSYQGYYVGLLSLLRNYDGILNGTVFCGLSSGIQNDLIKSIPQVLFTEIKKVTLSNNNGRNTNITNKCQVSTVFRNVDKSQAVQERIIGFSDFIYSRSYS